MLAFIAGATAVALQYEQLKEAQLIQKEERKVSMLSAKLAAIPHLIEHCNQRLKNVPDPDIPPNIFCGTTEQSLVQLKEMVEGSEQIIKDENTKIAHLKRKMAAFYRHAHRGIPHNTKSFEDEINERNQSVLKHIHLSKARDQYRRILEERFRYENELLRIYTELSS
jgi:hypothetical protein